LTNKKLSKSVKVVLQFVAMNSQDIINSFHQMTIELGRPPTRDEFKRVVPRSKFEVHFGSWSQLLKAMGVETQRVAKKIDQTIFNRDIEKHLSMHSPVSLPVMDDYEETLFIPDVHFPFEHQETLRQIYDFTETYKPKNIVQLGDLFDNFSHTKFPRSHNVFTPREEFNLSRSKAEVFWKTLQKASPQSKCFQISGNHCVRPMKRILEVYPEAEDWIGEMVSKMMSFDGVESIIDPRQELIMPGGVVAIHGYRSQLGSHRDYTLTNVVCGHTHRGGVVFRQVRGEIIWELNAGLAGDPTAKGLSYTSQKMVDWTLGWGWLDRFGPRFIPARKGSKS
jgi:predicted phosphodiesterase